MKVDWIDEALKGLKEIGFFDVLYTNHEWDWKDMNEGSLTELHLDMQGGCDKICFINLDHHDWVIKIDQERRINRCAIETTIYELACAEGLGAAFAETHFYTKIEDTEIYVQEYASVCSDNIHHTFVEYCSNWYDPNDFDDFECYRATVASAADDLNADECIYAVLGESPFTDRLVNFIEDHDINDLHSANWGTTADGRSVMIDFCGYLDDCSYKEMRWVCESRYCKV